MNIPVKHSTTKLRRAICPYCGVGCTITGEVRDGQILRAFADKTQSPNFGLLCQKGATLSSPGIWDRKGRATAPMLRDSLDEPWRVVTWEQAIAFVAERINGLREMHGKDAVGFYGSGQLDTEASYLFTKLFKGSLGTNHMDTNSRLCMSSAAAAYTQAFGSDGPPGCYEDIQDADLFFVIGANMAVNHPVLFTMLRKRMSSNADVRLIVVDPRCTPTALLAHEHLQVRPGGDVALVQYIARRLIAAGGVDTKFVEQFTEGFDAYSAYLSALDETELLNAAGLTTDQMEPVVQLFLSAKRRMSFYCQGLNQSTAGVDKNTAVINLHMQFGEIGRAGCGPFSLTGQPNAMGGREIGYLSHQLPGYRFVTDGSDRVAMEQLWGLHAGAIASEPGYSAVEMFDAIGDGGIRGVWICGTNPTVSMPNAGKVQRALRDAELVIVQDCYVPTESMEFAHVMLPAAQWGEKTGTMTNSERRVARSEKLFDPPGEAMPDWWIVCAIAREMGLAGFDYVTSDQVWDEVRQATKGRPCDMFGMTNARLRSGSLRWPCPTHDHAGTVRRYTDGRFDTPSGKARFHVLPYRAPAEAVDPTYPLVLTTGRVASQWHTRTRTGKVPELVAQNPEPFVEMHPIDADRWHMKDATWARLVSRRGEAVARLIVTESIRPGTLFTTFHFGELYGRNVNANCVTTPVFDPVSKQPELKCCAVRCEPADTPEMHDSLIAAKEVIA